MRYDSVRCEFNLNGTWTDLNAYRLQTAPIHGSMGFSDSQPVDRVAGTGTLTLTLRNVNNMFTPGHALCLSGFQSGMKFRLRMVLEGVTRTRFYGFVPADGIALDSNAYLSTATITVVDYMEHLATHALDLPAYTTSKRLDEVIALILANMPIAPLSTSYGTGKSTFTSVFDTVKDSTKALSEVGKATASELGYVYIKQSATCDEVLTVEARGGRNGKSLATFNVPSGNVDTRITEAGDTRITEVEYISYFDRVNYTRIISPPSVSGGTAIFTGGWRSMGLSHARAYYNRVNAKAYPRKADANNVVLFTLDKPISITSGQTVTIKGTFRDPSQQAQSVAAVSTVSPTATTDYLFNTAENGSGTNITADLSVTASYGVNGVEYTLKNNNASTGYVTLLQARGKAVYTYRPVEIVKKDTTLINTDGDKPLTLEMTYQDNPLVTEDVATAMLEKHKEKLTTLRSVTFSANRDGETAADFYAMAFLCLQVGDKIKIVDDTAGLDRDAFIHRIDFSIGSGDVVEYTYELKDAQYDVYTAWILDDAIYGVLAGDDPTTGTTILGY